MFCRKADFLCRNARQNHPDNNSSQTNCKNSKSTEPQLQYKVITVYLTHFKFITIHK